MLRCRESNNAPSFEKRREQLAKLTGTLLPTANEEQANPNRADDIYGQATQTLIVRVRQHASEFPLVQEENTHYGFRRNLYALKPIAVVVLIVNVVFDVIWMIVVSVSVASGIALALHVLLALAWLFIVKADWVWQQGRTYAERLFQTLEDPRIFK
jgi:hypothetical protein